MHYFKIRETQAQAARTIAKMCHATYAIKKESQNIEVCVPPCSACLAKSAKRKFIKPVKNQK